MLAEIRNYAGTRIVPTAVGNIRIPARRVKYESDPEVLRALVALKNDRRLYRIEIRMIEGELPGLTGPDKEPRTDFSKYSVNELRTLAADVGIEGSFYMTKDNLIKRLEEKNGTART